MAATAAKPSAGFTRLELMVVLAMLSCLVVIGAVLLARWKRERQAQQCSSNIKEIALGFVLWINDRDLNKMPWAVPMKDGGNRGFQPLSLRQNAWFQFGSLTNELKSPGVLADPADRRRALRRATSWSSMRPEDFSIAHIRIMRAVTRFVLMGTSGAGWHR